MKFTKMHGIGNDFVLIDVIRDGLPDRNLNDLAKSVCHREAGIGADGLILVDKHPSLRMRMFNPDGSESEMCGNGLRTVARLAFDRGYSQEPQFEIETGAGPLKVSVSDKSVTVDMGMAILAPSQIGMTVTSDTFVNEIIVGQLRATAVSMGNPHLVIFVKELAQVDIKKDGPLLETHPFFPHRTNVHFAQILSSNQIAMKTWERGAGATLACGTGACATAVAGYLNKHVGREVELELPGGKLSIAYQESGHVMMTGPAEYVLEGVLSGF